MQEWIDDALAAAGRTRTGPVTPTRTRPWGAVFTAPTTDGPVWLKAAPPAMAFEVALYPVLVRVVPDRVLHPLAVDVERGWVLLPDGGPTLADRADPPEALAAALEPVVGHYARLQRDLAPHTDELLAAGLVDMRPAVLPQRFEEALVVDPALGARRAEVADWCARLAAAPGAAGVDHNDLHPGNVLRGPRFYDWGDAVLAHPFASMLVPLRYLAHDLGGPRDPRVLRVRDAYLAEFADLAPRTELVDALELACRLGAIARTLVWLRALGPDPSETATRFADAPRRTLRALLADSPFDPA